jgi:hypothetical protein
MSDGVVGILAQRVFAENGRGRVFKHWGWILDNLTLVGTGGAKAQTYALSAVVAFEALHASDLVWVPFA